MVSVIEVKVTVSPELAVAVTLPVAGRVMELGAVILIVWLPFATLLLCFTCGAGL